MFPLHATFEKLHKGACLRLLTVQAEFSRHIWITRQIHWLPENRWYIGVHLSYRQETREISQAFVGWIHLLNQYHSIFPMAQLLLVKASTVNNRAKLLIYLRHVDLLKFFMLIMTVRDRFISLCLQFSNQINCSATTTSRIRKAHKSSPHSVSFLEQMSTQFVECLKTPS